MTRFLLAVGALLGTVALTLVGAAVVFGTAGLRAESDRSGIEGQMLAAHTEQQVVSAEAYAGWDSCGVGSVVFADGRREDVVVVRNGGVWQMEPVAVVRDVHSESDCRALVAK